MKLFISGKGKFVKRTMTPAEQRIQKFLDGSKDGELFANTQLGLLVHLNRDTIKKSVYVLEGYTHKVKNLRYWGKPVTIKQLIKETQDEG